jgi:hypothetical protein
LLFVKRALPKTIHLDGTNMLLFSQFSINTATFPTCFKLLMLCNFWVQFIFSGFEPTFLRSLCPTQDIYVDEIRLFQSVFREQQIERKNMEGARENSIFGNTVYENVRNLCLLSELLFFLDFFHRPVFYKIENTTFRKLGLFRP